MNVLENGIASGRGDCPQTVVAAQPKQSGESQVKSESVKKAGINLRAFNQTQRSYANKISKDDHIGIVLDQAKVDRPDSCVCCKREVGKLEKLWDQKKKTRVIVWEKPKAKFKGMSITAHDYTTHYSYPKREIPPWHPHQRHPWKNLDVASVTDTTYTREFAPPTHKRLHLRARMDRMQHDAQNSNSPM